ncbi:tyrosine-specific transport protein 1, partial [Quercus suber]
DHGQETLGEWGGTLATVTYVFLGYTSMIAYSSKSGDILFHLINLPASISGIFFTSVFTMLISIGGTRATDQVNQWLTTSMIGLLLAIEVLAVVSGGWAGLGGSGNWGKVPATIPVIIFSLVYHDLAPVLCAYLGGDLTRIRTSVLLGSLVPLLALLVWDAVALGLSAQSDQVVDPVELLMRVKWSGVSIMVEAFSLLAGNKLFGLRKWWGRNKSLTAMTMAVTPALFVSSTVPDAFSAATDIAGGYCMTILYGVLPPAMAWAMLNREAEDPEQKAFSKARPLLLGVGLFACCIVIEQVLQDILLFGS